MSVSCVKLKLIMETTNKRNTNFEILRIIAIIFIIAHHFAYHSNLYFGGYEPSILISVNSIYVEFLNQLGKIGVNLFILISSYFLIDNKGFKTKKVLSIFFEALIFSLVIGFTFFIVNQKEFSFDLLRNLLFPIGSSTWWFITIYLLLYLIHPLLNILINNMNKKLHLFFVILFITIWSILPTLLGINYAFNYLGWFITLYFLVGYIKKYDINIKLKPYQSALIGVGVFIIWFIIKIVIERYTSGGQFINELLRLFSLDMNNIIQLGFSLLLFISFKNMKYRSNNVINFIASFTLAIYLFHDHFDIRHFLWIDLFKVASFGDNSLFILYSLGIILSVFVMGLIVGIIYKYSFGLLINKFLNYLDKKCLYKIDNLFS